MKINEPEDLADSDWAITFPLKFAGAEVENAYRERFISATIGLVRTAIVLVIALFICFFLVDLWVLPDHLENALLVRAATVAFASAIVGISFTPLFRPYWEWWMGSVPVVGSGFIALFCLVTSDLALTLYPQAVTFAMLWIFLIARVRFMIAMATSLLSIAVFNAGISIDPRFTAELYVNHSFFFLSAVFMGAISCFMLELYTRRSFRTRRQVELQNKQLVEEIAEREKAERAQAKARMELEHI